ncbi:MAG: XcyI family restriction endonuclease [Anaerolineae bacterium]|nr:XcyI family restriction endonuclease [Anaerolineae bacterium]
MRQRRSRDIETWTLDQLAKSAFFHSKLHEWRLLEVADALEAVHGETLSWDDLGIVKQAWEKVIHRGIKPVLVFAHPTVLQNIAGAVSYYRMLAMVSQKSMKRIGIDLDEYERGRQLDDPEKAVRISQHLNRIISILVEADAQLNRKEFDLWRGMAAGAQAQGAWQNSKGSRAEIAVREIILQRLSAKSLVAGNAATDMRFDLADGRQLLFSDEPDIVIYKGNAPQVVIEVKGGIDRAGVLERVGAAIKSLQRTRREYPQAVTILTLHQAAISERMYKDLQLSADVVNHVLDLNEVLGGTARERFFEILDI